MRWFLAEFLVVVAGILAALALNSWYQNRQDAANEKDYLQLLSRDLGDTVKDLDDAAAFEGLQLKDGILAYRAVWATAPRNTEEASAALSRLGQRRTMMLKNATYEDMVDTGNIRLIRNRRLRDHIATFYHVTSLEFEILNKNNLSMIDDGYQRNVLMSGLVVNRLGSNLPVLIAADKRLTNDLGETHLAAQTDPLWELPANAPQWAMVRSNLIMRLRLATLSQLIDQQNAVAARALKAEVDAQIGR